MMETRENCEQQVEKRDYVTRYKDLEITEIGKRGEIVIGTSQVSARDFDYTEVEEMGIKVDNIVISTEAQDGGIRKVSLKEYLHADFHFAFNLNDKRFETNHTKNLLVYPRIGNKGDQLSLLHELWHTNQEKGGAFSEELRSLENKFHRKVELSAEEIDRARILFELAAQHERDAWAWAIKKLKEFRVEDIDLEPELEKREEIMSEIAEGLKSYDYNSANFIKKVFGEPIFWRKKGEEWIKEFNKSPF